MKDAHANKRRGGYGALTHQYIQEQCKISNKLIIVPLDPIEFANKVYSVLSKTQYEWWVLGTNILDICTLIILYMNWWWKTLCSHALHDFSYQYDYFTNIWVQWTEENYRTQRTIPISTWRGLKNENFASIAFCLLCRYRSACFSKNCVVFPTQTTSGD